MLQKWQQASVAENRTQLPHTDNRKPKAESQFTVEVILVLEGDGTTGELTQEEMRMVCLHEFGHAIGLWGHSPDDTDVCYAMATAQHPTQRDINTLLKLYNTLLDTPQHEIAIEVLKKELQTNPRHARPHYLLGAVYFDKGDIAPAIVSFQNCLKVDPNFQPATEKLIQAYQRTGQSNQAIRLVEQSVKSQHGHQAFRESANSYNVLGTLYYREGDVDKAIQAFENALKRSPHHKEAKRNLHQLFRQKALATFETVLAKSPKNTVAYQNLVSLESQLVVAVDKARTAAQSNTDTNEATPNPDTVIGTPDPTVEKLSRVQCALTRCLMNRKQPKNAMEKYRQALKAEPYTPELRARLIDTGKWLANQFQKRNDTDSYETIVRWTTALDSNFKELIDP